MDYLDKFAGKVAVVTGGAGLIGGNLVRRLTELEAMKVIVVDDLSGGHRWSVPQHGAVEFIEASILEEQVLRRVFREKPQYVFHLAAHFANQKAIEYPEDNLAVNGLGTLKLLEWSHLVGVERFVFTSAGCSAYGSKAPVPLTEDFVTLYLDTPYQIHKLLGELYCNFFYEFYGLSTVKLRLFNVYGPGGVPGKYKNVIPNFIFWALQGKPLPVMGTGNESRDFTFVMDAVDGLLRAGAIEKATGETMNMGSGRETRTIDLANLVNRITENNAGITSIGKRDWDKSNRRFASIERAKAVLDYNPPTQIEKGIERTVAWFKDNFDRITASAVF